MSECKTILKRPNIKCVHGKRKCNCKECGGSNICEHNRQRPKCKDCGGSYICKHNKRKNECKECKGSSICEHNKQRYICKDCEGSQICDHNKRKSICKECKGRSICEHNNIRSNCLDCKGGSICNHKNIKSKCKECGGISICKHKKEKKNCIECKPECSCQECKSIFVDKRTNCYPLCQACFCNKYPDHEKSTLYKIKERYLRDELRIMFPNNDINMLFDKKVEGGCSSRKPDVLIDCLTHSIIVECDENQHKSYKCEERRTNELYLDLGDRPLIMIRFNPDSYIDKNNIKVEGCFKPLTKIEDMHKRKFYDLKKEEWKRRVDILVEELKKHLDLDTDVLYKEVKLFYDKI
jgi:hypothetical protein